VARANAKEVKPTRLIRVGAADYHEYACQQGTLQQGYMTHIPYLVEAWALPSNRTTLQVCVNRAPVTANAYAARDKREINMFGCGIEDTIAEAPKDKHFAITLNIIAPYMPITSDGKKRLILKYSLRLSSVRQVASFGKHIVPVPQVNLKRA